jgi:hypothetical protein
MPLVAPKRAALHAMPLVTAARVSLRPPATVESVPAPQCHSAVRVTSPLHTPHLERGKEKTPTFRQRRYDERTVVGVGKQQVRATA